MLESNSQTQIEQKTEYMNRRTRDSLRYINPNATEEDVIFYKWINKWMLYVKFKSGRKVIYNAFNNGIKALPYPDSMILSEEDFKNFFSYMLTCLMDQEFMTQSQLAEKIGTTQQQVSKYVNGEVVPTPYMIYKIANVLNCEPNELIYNKNYIM